LGAGGTTEKGGTLPVGAGEEVVAHAGRGSRERGKTEGKETPYELLEGDEHCGDIHAGLRPQEEGSLGIESRREQRKRTFLGGEGISSSEGRKGNRCS